jgi:6-phosphofructokinase
MAARNLMIVQGGGPTAVFNASLAACIEEARSDRGVHHVYGARSGAAGLSRGEVCDLTGITASELDMLRNTPGAALGSSRFKPSEEDLYRQLETLRALDVHSMLFLGGNGTMHGAQLFTEFCTAQGYALEAVGIPKTVDNDLTGTDRSPGFASAARYVAQSTQDLGLDLRSLPQPVTILETMGRSVGWLAAASVLAKDSVGAAPHIVLLPEIPFDQDAFLAAVEQAVTRYGWAVAVVAEGIRNADGSLVYSVTDPAQQDPLKRPFTGGVARHLAQTVATQLKMRCRHETPGLLGRASIAHRSEQDLRDAVDVAIAGVQALRNGQSGHMAALTPIGSSSPTTLISLEEVAGLERTIPEAWLSDGPLAVSEACLDYLRPLVGSLPQYAPELPSLSLSTIGVR